MSVVITTDIFCDGDGCAKWDDGVTGPKPMPSAARKEVKRLGWRHIRRKDYCPDCAVKIIVEKGGS